MDQHILQYAAKTGKQPVALDMLTAGFKPDDTVHLGGDSSTWKPRSASVGPQSPACLLYKIPRAAYDYH